MTGAFPSHEKKLKIWLQATRPRSLTATYVPVALGGVLAWEADRFNLLDFVLALLGVLLLQIGANLTNEYYDFIKGSDAQKTHGLGMILSRQALTPREVFTGGVVSILLGAFIGLYFVITSGWVVLIIGIFAVLVAILYTAGPAPLAYIGLGEIAVFIFMGPLIVLGTYFVLTDDLRWLPVWASLPVAFAVANILHANNLRDLEADRAMQKYTLAAIFGRRFARAEFVFLIGGMFVSTVMLVITETAPLTTLAVFVLLPEVWRMIQIAITSTDTAQLHQILIRTARLHKWFGILFVGAWLFYVLSGKI